MTLYSLSRIRLNVTVRPLGWLTFYARLQDARVFGYSRRPIPSSVEDTADLRIRCVQIGDPESNRWSVRAGRQEISLGDGRMVGYIGWRNAANVNHSETGNRLYGGYGGIDLPGGTVEPMDCYG